MLVIYSYGVFRYFVAVLVFFCLMRFASNLFLKGFWLSFYRTEKIVILNCSEYDGWKLLGIVLLKHLMLLWVDAMLIHFFVKFYVLKVSAELRKQACCCWDAEIVKEIKG